MNLRAKHTEQGGKGETMEAITKRLMVVETAVVRNEILFITEDQIDSWMATPINIPGIGYECSPEHAISLGHTDMVLYHIRYLNRKSAKRFSGR